MEVRPLPQQRHPLMHAPLHPQQQQQQQQFAPSHPQPQAASQSLNTPQQQPLPMQQPAPLQQPHYGLGSRPSLLPGSVNPGSLVPPLIGQKRDSSGISHAPSQFGDSADGGNFAKLFVGSVPRNTTEEEVRRMFSEFGNITEVALIRDKRTGLQQGCCFIKYATVEEAERAIHGLHNQRTLPGGTGPVQVRFAGGEHERLDSGHITAGAMEHKLFVGSLNKQATEKEIEEIFAPYGRVDDVYIMRDDQKQSKGCAFVKFASRDMAMAAINALNGVYRMPGCDQPITVRFADPKRPRSSDPRMGGPGFGGPSFSPRSGHVPFGPRGSAGPGGPLGAHNPSFNWRPLGGVGMASVSQQGLRPYGGSSTPRGGPTTMGTQMVNGSLTAPPQASTPVSGPVASLVMPLLSQQQGFNQPPLQRPTQGYGQQMALQQLPQAQQHLLQVPNQQHQHQQLHPQGQIQSLQQPSQTYPSTQSSDLRLQHQGGFGQLSAAQVSLQPYSQFTASQVQHPVPLAVQQSVPTVQAQQIALQVSQQQQFAQAAQHPPVLQSIHNQQQQQQQPLVVQPGSIQLQQQQQQQQQLQQQQQHQQHQQQQLQQQQQQQQQPQQFSLSQPSSQQQQQPQIQPLQTSQQAYFQGSLPPVQQQVTLQPSWSLPLQSQVGSSVSVATTSPVSSTPPAPVATCDWTEHTSPEGHKYYYNSTTGESRWEKPEELTTFEQKQQQQQQQQQRQSSLQQAAVQYASSGAPAHQTIQNLGYGQVQPASGLPQQISAGQQIAPTQQMFPGQQMVPGQQVTPLHQIVHGQQVVPAQVHAQQAQQIVPGHQMSHVQQVVPGQQMTPAQQILPGQQTLPAQQGVSSVQDWMWRMKPTGP